jgi:single-strand DNA-binding protein
MNQVVLTGRLTKDIELRYAEGSGKAIGKFSLAVDRDFKKEGQTDVDFINCIAFDKKAETIANYVKKGHKLGVIGRIQTGSYDNKDGNKVYTTDVIVDKIEFLQPKGNDNQSSVPKADNEIPDDYFGGGEEGIPF